MPRIDRTVCSQYTLSDVEVTPCAGSPRSMFARRIDPSHADDVIDDLLSGNSALFPSFAAGRNRVIVPFNAARLGSSWPSIRRPIALVAPTTRIKIIVEIVGADIDALPAGTSCVINDLQHSLGMDCMLHVSLTSLPTLDDCLADLMPSLLFVEPPAQPVAGPGGVYNYLHDGRLTADRFGTFLIGSPELLSRCLPDQLDGTIALRCSGATRQLPWPGARRASTSPAALAA